jgi:hypothetical protein
MLILKENAANSVPTPPIGKDTFFIDDSGTPSVKNADGNVTTFPVVNASNAQVVFMNGSSLYGEAALIYDFNNNVLTVSGNIAAGNVKTDNLLYANGSPWDLQNPAGANTAIQFNDADSFGGSAAFTFDKTSNLVSVLGNLNAANVNVTSSLISGNIYANSGTVGASLLTGTLTTASQPNITSVGTLGSLSVTGNANVGNIGAAAGVFTTVAGSLTTASQPNVTTVGTLGTLSVTGNANVGNIGAAAGVFTTVAGSLTTASQGNITSVGTLTGLGVNGNLTAANITANTGSFSGNAAGLTNIPGGNIVGNISGNISNAAHATTANTIVDAAQPNITSVGTLTSVSVTGNANVGNLGTAQVLASANVTAPQYISNIATGTAPLVVSSTTKVANLNADLLDGFSTAVAGTANTVVIRDADGSFSANVVTATLSGAATTAGTVTTASQPNITSVGTLTSLSVTGNATAGNVDAGNLLTANFVTGTLTTAAQPNITSVGSLTSLSVLGNANVGNIGGNNAVFTLVTGTLTTASQPNVTSVGTLTTLSVSGNANVGNLGTAQVLATANITAPQLISNVSTGTAPLVVTSTTKVTNLNADLLDGYNTATAATANTVVVRDADGSFSANIVTATLSGAATTAGTVTTASQPNITSVGTLTSVDVTGNATAGNVYANSGTIGASLLTGTLTTASQPNITSVGTLSSLSVTGNVAAGNLTTTGILSVTGTGTSSIAGNLDMTSNTIINLATPTNATDAATKQYVDDVAQGLNVHDSCQAATPDTLANITSGTISYNNGSNGVGAYLSTTGTFNLIDGVNVQTSGTRILVKNEANAVFNGIYTYTNTTAITRAADFNTVPEVEAGDFTFVTGGTLYDNTGWVQTESPTGIGTAGNNISFTQFSGAGTYQAGTGLTLTGTTFSISNTAVSAASYGNGDRVASFTVNGQGQLTAASNVVIAANAANLTGTTLNSSIVTSSLTTVGTLGTLSVTGNANVGNIGAAAGVFTTVAGSLTTASQPNITSVGTLTSLAVTGNVTAGNVYANSGTIGASLVTGTLTTASQPNITSVGTLTSLAVTGNVTAGNVYANSGTIGANLLTGTLTTAAQPNITSVGTLTSISSSGNITAPSHIANTGYFVASVNAAVSAAGTAQGNATVLASQVNVTSTVASGAGVALPSATAGMRITVINTAANAVLVYPASGGTINSLAANAAFSLAASGRLDFQAVSTTQWYTLNATYA